MGKPGNAMFNLFTLVFQTAHTKIGGGKNDLNVLEFLNASTCFTIQRFQIYTSNSQ